LRRKGKATKKGEQVEARKGVEKEEKEKGKEEKNAVRNRR